MLGKDRQTGQHAAQQWGVRRRKCEKQLCKGQGESRSGSKEGEEGFGGQDEQEEEQEEEREEEQEEEEEQGVVLAPETKF